MKQITIRESFNERTFVRKYLIYHVGMNIGIQSIKEETKNHFRVVLEANIPYNIELENGMSFSSHLRIKKVGQMLIVADKKHFGIDERPNLKIIDRKINREIKRFNKNLKIKSITWSGKKITLQKKSGNSK